MIVESALAVIALIAIGVVFKETNIGGGEKFLLTAPPTIFAGGVATMVATMFGGVADFSNPVYDTTYTLLTLAVSVFALTSLDSGTRLSRYMFAELFIPEGKTRDELTGARKFFSHPLVSTIIVSDANDWIREVCESTGVYFTDSAKAVGDGTGAVLSSYLSSNGKTLNSSGITEILNHLRTHALSLD